MVYCTSLENWRCASIPGFESQSLRFGGKTMNIGAFFLILRGILEPENRNDVDLVKMMTFQTLLFYQLHF